MIPCSALNSPDGRVISSCDVRFLHTLSLEITRARTFPSVRCVKPVDEEQQLRRLGFLIHELHRLFNNPGLFPSLVHQVRFAALVGSDAELQLTQACNDLLIAEQIQKLHSISRTQWTRKTFNAGALNWENFLSDGAPGTGLQTQETIPKSSFQVIPAVGMRIVGDYEREEQEIIQHIHRVSRCYSLCPL